MPSHNCHGKVKNIVHDHHHYYYYYHHNPEFHSYWFQGHKSERDQERRGKSVMPQWHRPERGGEKDGMIYGNTITTSFSTASSSSGPGPGSGCAYAYEPSTVAASAQAYRYSPAYVYETRGRRCDSRSNDDDDDDGGREGLPAWFTAKSSACAMNQSRGIRAATDTATLSAADAAHRSLLRDMVLGRYMVPGSLTGGKLLGGEKEGCCVDVDDVRVLFVEGRQNKKKGQYEVKRRSEEARLVWRKRGGW